jgi:hypothetical protein
MKSILFAITTCFLSLPLQANPDIESIEKVSGPSIVSKRLASKSLTEVVVIAMKLQLECQQLNSQDVCEGVKNILNELDSRLAGIPPTDQNTSIAFVKGLMEGVSEANQAVMAHMPRLP